ncbi:MAG: GNAT family N-acetyltransferase [Lachnospiraceae bacterium]
MYIELQTERLVLKPLGLQYLESVHSYASDIENTRYMLHLPNTSIEETAAFLRGADMEWNKNQPEFYEFAVFYENHPIGAVSIYLEDDVKTGELGWILDKKYWNKGIVTEAARELISFSVRRCGITHFIAHCDTENLASCCVMEKLGMRRTGEYGGRKNKASSEERREYQYELYASLLETTKNTRDLGGYRTKEGKLTKFHSILRSDRQLQSSAKDMNFLIEHNITTIIDLRAKELVECVPSSFSGVAGFQYFNYPMEEGSRIPESEAAVPESYMEIAAAKEMPNVFRCIANAESGVMYHCSAGKDRTGVVSAILLLHAGVSDKEIVQDYVDTKEYLAEILKTIPINFPRINMNIVTPCPAYMTEFLRRFRDTYVDTDHYFRQLGLTEKEREKIRRKLV